jgi:hypothetical protein
MLDHGYCRRRLPVNYLLTSSFVETHINLGLLNHNAEDLKKSETFYRFRGPSIKLTTTTG